VGHQAVVEIRDVSKRFGSTQALDHVTMAIRAGEVLAFLGANGAGKSTLIKILAGVYALDSGSITGVDGSSLDSVKFSFIHQDLGLVGWMTVAESVAQGTSYPRPRGLISWRQVRTQARSALASVAPHIEVDARIDSLSRADQSLVAIARALAAKSDVLVLDEPTASLQADDCEHLINVVRDLSSTGVAVVYVSHRLDEVFKVADRIVVLRDGRMVEDGPLADFTPQSLVTSIVGRTTEAHLRGSGTKGAPLLNVRRIDAENVDCVSFDLHKGEILALIGLNGAGQREVGRAIAGDLPLFDGEILIDGAKAPGNVPHAVAAGICLITSSRAEEGLALDLSVRENITPNPSARDRRAWQMIRPSRERSQAASITSDYHVNPPFTESPVATLSGGNQQKVIIGRWFSTSARLIVLEEPTAGVDFGAKQDIYAAMEEAANRGVGLLLVSSDFEEVALISDRALVFSDGRIVKELQRAEISVEALVGYASRAMAEGK
jgi:ribose transport system ATP-binding protein